MSNQGVEFLDGVEYEGALTVNGRLSGAGGLRVLKPRGCGATNIEWADFTANPVRAVDPGTGKVGWFCRKVSGGCANCYAEYLNQHRFGNGAGYTAGEIARLEPFLDFGVLQRLLTMKPKPDPATGLFKNGRTRPAVFMGDMNDLFYGDEADRRAAESSGGAGVPLKAVPFEWIDRIMAVCALRPDIDFLFLTKRPERMAEYFNRPHPHYAVHEALDRLCSTLDDGTVPAKLDPLNGRRFIVPRRLWAQAPAFPTGLQWPLPNVWRGTSCEDQAAADERIPHLLRCPGLLFLSCEPLIGGIDLTRVRWDLAYGWKQEQYQNALDDSVSQLAKDAGIDRTHRIDWVIAGGESGKGARPCDIAWIRSIVKQCQGAGVPVFVKQLGSRPVSTFDEWNQGGWTDGNLVGDVMHWSLTNKKGGDMSEWPEDLRVREMPGVRT